MNKDRVILSESNKRIILGFVLFLMTIAVSFPSIFVKYPSVSPDIHFHLNRIIGIAEELSHGHFPVRMSSYWLNGYGYPASVYYGDILLYFPAVLYMLGINIINCYRIYILFINVITIVLAYICFSKIFDGRRISLILTMIYCTSNYRLSDIYYRGAIGEATAIAFLPLILYALYRIYSFNENRLSTYIIFTFGMTGVLVSHIITFVLVIIGILFICIFFYKSTFKWVTIKTYIISAVLTIGLSAYFLIPFLDYYISENTAISNTVKSGNSELYYNSAVLIELFNFFGESDKISYTPGMFLIIPFLICIPLIIQKKIGKSEIKVFFISAMILIISSNIFPWDMLIKYSKIFTFISAIQFPFRFITIAVVFMAYLAGRMFIILRKNDPVLFKKLIIVVICLNAFVFGKYVIDYYLKNHLNTELCANTYDIGAGGEYLLSGAEKNDFSKTDILCDGDIILKKQDGTDREYYVNDYHSGTMVSLPILNYKYYNVYDKNGNLINIVDSDNKRISFMLDDGYIGDIKLIYEEPMIWRLSEWISVISLICIFLCMIISFVRRRKV